MNNHTIRTTKYKSARGQDVHFTMNAAGTKITITLGEEECTLGYMDMFNIITELASYKKKPLSKTKDRVFRYYREYQATYGCYPTYMAAGKNLGKDPSVVYYHVKALNKQGLIEMPNARKNKNH